MTAVFPLCFGLLVLLPGDPVLDAFEGQDLQAYVAGTTAVVVALSAAADVLACLVLRGRRLGLGGSGK